MKFARFTAVAFVTAVALTAACDARPFIVAGGGDVAPFQSVGADGKVVGILVDIYAECFRRLDIELLYEPYPWARAQHHVESGEADGMSTVITEDRLRYAVPGQVVLAEERFVAFANAVNPHFDEIMKAHSLQELQHLRVLAQFGSGWVAENFPKTAIEYASTRSDLLEMLALGRGDVVIAGEVTTRRRLETLRRDNADLPFDAITGSANVLAMLEFHFMISKKSVYLNRLGDIDRTLEEMRQDGTIRRIYGKFGLDGAS